MAKLGPCLVGMEACHTAHYCAHELEEFGHQMKLMANPVHPTLHQEQQERYARRRGNLRNRHAADHALRPNQEPRAAGSTSGAPGAPASGQGAGGPGQSVTRFPRPAWNPDPQGIRRSQVCAPEIINDLENGLSGLIHGLIRDLYSASG